MSLGAIKDAFRSDMAEAIGHCGIYDAIAVLGWLGGVSEYVQGMGEDEDAFLARRTIELAVICIADEQSDGTIDNPMEAGDIVTAWVRETIAELEAAQAQGYSCWQAALQARA